jgi:hypothetical protein
MTNLIVFLICATFAFIGADVGVYLIETVSNLGQR